MDHRRRDRDPECEAAVRYDRRVGRAAEFFNLQQHILCCIVVVRMCTGPRKALRMKTLGIMLAVIVVGIGA
jgi:hypothetical protein